VDSQEFTSPESLSRWWTPSQRSIDLDAYVDFETGSPPFHGARKVFSPRSFSKDTLSKFEPVESVNSPLRFSDYCRNPTQKERESRLSPHYSLFLFSSESSPGSWYRRYEWWIKATHRPCVKDSRGPGKDSANDSVQGKKKL